MTILHWILVVSLCLMLLGALGYAGAGAIGRAMFDAPPKPREDYGERDERDPVIPMAGSQFIESTQVIKRTEAGGTITVLHLTPEGRRALSVEDDE